LTKSSFGNNQPKQHFNIVIFNQPLPNGGFAAVKKLCQVFKKRGKFLDSK
jgi:hypothetical protein